MDGVITMYEKIMEALEINLHTWKCEGACCYSLKISETHNKHIPACRRGIWVVFFSFYRSMELLQIPQQSVLKNQAKKLPTFKGHITK